MTVSSYKLDTLANIYRCQCLKPDETISNSQQV